MALLLVVVSGSVNPTTAVDAVGGSCIDRLWLVDSVKV